MHNNGGRHNNRGRGGNNNNRGPRKNYPQLREKYMNQARDALSSGDRVMAEYYFQHADHCFRMMAEEGYNKPRHQNNPSQDANDATGDVGNDNSDSLNDSEVENESADEMLKSASGLPAFLTMGGADANKGTPAPVQDWEERDAN